jgi:hypothetical protein
MRQNTGTEALNDNPLILGRTHKIGTHKAQYATIFAGYNSDSGRVTHGFLRKPDGTFKSFDPPGSAYTRPQCINKTRAIAGYYADSGGVYHGFLRSR